MKKKSEFVAGGSYDNTSRQKLWELLEMPNVNSHPIFTTKGPTVASSRKTLET